MQKERCAVIAPPGYFGTSLAIPLSVNFEEVILLFRFLYQKEAFDRLRENVEKFPGIKLPDNVYASANPREVLPKANMVILTPKAQKLRSYYSEIYSYIPDNCPVVHGVKGLEADTNLRPSQVLKEVNPKLDKLAVISGANYAQEIIRGLLTVTVIASENDELALKVSESFRTEKFRPFITDDIVGVELGGSLKNLVAIAVGISDGMMMGNNAAAGLMNRLIKEVTRLSVVLGADERTMAGIAGLGDIVVSSKPPSRNYLAGYDIGQGADPRVLRQSGKTIEGLDSVEPAIALAEKFGVEVPILQILKEIICGNLKPQGAIDRVMSLDGSYYEDPQPIIDRRLRFPLRAINRLFHLWNQAT